MASNAMQIFDIGSTTYRWHLSIQKIRSRLQREARFSICILCDTDLTDLELVRPHRMPRVDRIHVGKPEILDADLFFIRHLLQFLTGHTLNHCRIFRIDLNVEIEPNVNSHSGDFPRDCVCGSVHLNSIRAERLGG